MKNIYYLRNQQVWKTDTIASARSNSQLRRASPTSRKTEPRRSLSLKHKIRQHHTIQPISQSSNTNRRTHQQQPSSSNQRKPTIIHFRRVQQPSNTQRIGVANGRKEESKGGKGHSKCEARSKAKQTQQQHQMPVRQIQQDSLSSFQGLYSLQPMRKLFLCQKCIAYLPTIEIKSHFAHCVAPKSHHQHLERWTQVAQLLQEINRVQPQSQLFKVAALMLAYAHNQRTEGKGLLYSEELSRILACRSVLSTGYLNEGQLFEVLERLGDKLETVPRQGWCS